MSGYRPSAKNLAPNSVSACWPCFTTPTNGQHVWVGHVGNARACLHREGALLHLTTDQSVVGQLVAAGKLSEEASGNHPQAHVLLQTVGGDMKLQPDIHETALQNGDRLLLCNQATVRALGDEHISSSRPTPTPDKWCDGSRDATLRGEGNNTTALLLDVGPSNTV